MAQMRAEISYETPVGLPDGTQLYHSAHRIIAIPDAAESQEAIATLFKLVDGILGAPEEPKKRKVKKANETFNRKVGRFAAGIDFLLAAGFLEGDDPDAEGEAAKGGLLFMPIAYMGRLTDSHHTLAQAASEVGMAAPPLPSGGFNPYASVAQSADTLRAKASAQWKGEADKLRDEVKKRQREMEAKVETAPPIDLQPSAFWLSGGRRLEEVVKETAEAGDADRATDNALMQAQVASAKGCIDQSNLKFESADKKRLAELSRKKVYQFCILRIICPDKSVLQVHFRSGEKGEQVLAAIAPLFTQTVTDAGWYIYQSPPLKKLNPRETLAQAGLSPGANMYLGFEGSTKPAGPYLAPHLASQLGAAPQASQGVVGGPSFSGEAMGWGGGRKLGGTAPAASAAAATPASAAPTASGEAPPQKDWV